MAAAVHRYTCVRFSALLDTLWDTSKTIFTERSDDPTNIVNCRGRVVIYPESSRSHQAHIITMLQ